MFRRITALNLALLHDAIAPLLEVVELLQQKQVYGDVSVHGMSAVRVETEPSSDSVLCQLRDPIFEPTFRQLGRNSGCRGSFSSSFGAACGSAATNFCFFALV